MAVTVNLGTSCTGAPFPVSNFIRVYSLGIKRLKDASLLVLTFAQRVHHLWVVIRLQSCYTHLLTDDLESIFGRNSGMKKSPLEELYFFLILEHLFSFKIK